MKKKIIALITLVVLAVLQAPGSVFASSSSFLGYTYKGTGYTTNGNLVAKIDTYFYENLRDEDFCACDVYFYERNSAGRTIRTNVYGYAVAQFERGSNVFGSSGRRYGYTNVEAWSDAVYYLNAATPHYYGSALY